MRRWKNPCTITKRTYFSWVSARNRCGNPKDPDYANYGGRGITMCDRWIDNYDAFYEDMGPRPEGHEIERIDNDQGYDPFNCIWADEETQANNRRTNRLLEGKTLARQAKINDLTPQSVKYRADQGIPLSRKKRAMEAQHGSVSRYTSVKHKCRCADCREAWRVYNYKKRAA